VNLKPDFSFINTIPAGTEALNGEIILHIPETSKDIKGEELGQNSIHEEENIRSSTT
jgi:hypothetical protein